MYEYTTRRVMNDGRIFWPVNVECIALAKGRQRARLTRYGAESTQMGCENSGACTLNLGMEDTGFLIYHHCILGAQLVQIHGWRRRCRLVLDRLGLGRGWSLLSATAEQHTSHHVEQWISTLPRDPDTKPYLANVRQCLAPEGVGLFQMPRIMLGQLTEERSVAFLCGEEQ